VIGCGCRGLALARELIAHGHAVRGTTRDRGRLGEIREPGVEAVLADPDRIATLSVALEHVTVAYVLLGSATGPDEAVAALHSDRLEMLLTRMVDTTVRGVAYEATGSVDRRLLQVGGERVQRICEDARIPYTLLDAHPGDHAGWVQTAVAAADRLLGGR
jgi:hypothetical protein